MLTLLMMYDRWNANIPENRARRGNKQDLDKCMSKLCSYEQKGLRAPHNRLIFERNEHAGFCDSSTLKPLIFLRFTKQALVWLTGYAFLGSPIFEHLLY